jgi:hypothetical protein
MYLGGSIMSFALPYGAFIVGALALFFLFRARHSGPRLKYLHTSDVTSVTTREPGPAPAPSVAADEAKVDSEPQAEAKAEAETDSPAAAEAKEPAEGEE